MIGVERVVGGILRKRLGHDQRAWLLTAVLLPSHRGSVRGFLRGKLLRTTGSPDPERADLRVLAQAPDDVIARNAARWATVAWLADPLPERRTALRDLVGVHARDAPPEFWVILARMLVEFPGTLPELLVTARAVSE